jgi:ribosomal protein S27AE
MNLWDSVHRGLEKASQEAARIARIQRLRSTVDTLNRQIYNQQGTLIAKAMDTFREGRMVQGELIPICQELVNLQQQLEQAQNELKQPQNQGPITIPSSFPPAMPITGPDSETLTNTQPTPAYPSVTEQAPPPALEYQFYANPTIPAPPPPPVTEPASISTAETVAIDGEKLPATSDQSSCPQCGQIAMATQAFCQNCGTLLKSREAAHFPTLRSGTNEEAKTTKIGVEDVNKIDGGE